MVKKKAKVVKKKATVPKTQKVEVTWAKKSFEATEELIKAIGVIMQMRVWCAAGNEARALERAKAIQARGNVVNVDILRQLWSHMRYTQRLLAANESED